MGWLGRMLLPLVLYDLTAAVWMRALPDGSSLMAQFLAAVSALAVLTPAWLRQPGGRKRAPFAAGKAAAFAAAYSLYLSDKKKGRGLLLCAAVMGFSRVYLLVHYPFDVIAGAALGMISAGFVHRKSEER